MLDVVRVPSLLLICCVSLQESGNALGIIVTCVANLPLCFATFAPIRFARNTRRGRPSAPPRMGGRAAVSMTWGQSRLEVPRLRNPFQNPPSPRGKGRKEGAGGGSQKANSARRRLGQIQG